MSAGIEVSERLSQLGLLARQTDDLDSLAREMLRIALEVTHASFAGFALTDSLHQEVSLRWAVSNPDNAAPEGERRRLGEGLAGAAAASLETVRLDSSETQGPGIAWLPSTRSGIAVPLSLGSSLVGILCLESPDQGALAGIDDVLDALRGPLAMGIGNLRAVEEGRDKRDQLTVISQVTRIITSTVDLDVLLQRTVDCIRGQLGYQLVGVGLLDEETNRVLHCAASSESTIDLSLGHSQALGEGVAGEVVLTGKSVLVPDVRLRTNYVAAAPSVRSEICVPLRDGDRTFGFLDAESDDPYAFDVEDLTLLEMVADHVSQAIRNARALRQITRLRDDLTSMLVHDLRSPLSVVLTSLEMLRATLVRQGLSERLRVLDAAQSACEEMLILVGGLLDLHKLEAGEFPVRLRRCLPEEIVRSVSGRLSVVAAARQVTLESEIGCPGLTALLDVDLMTRVLENLTANALKYTPEAGRVCISIQQGSATGGTRALPSGAPAIQFTVRDSGIPISEEIRARIFDKFSTLEPRRLDVRYSTGLGLAFCKRAVEAHGGLIWLETGEQEGNAFCCLVPVQAGSAETGTHRS